MVSLIAVAHFAPNRIVAQQAHGAASSNAALSSQKNSKLSARLEAIANDSPALQTSDTIVDLLSNGNAGPGSLIQDTTGAVLTYVRVSETSEATLATLRALGANVTHVDTQYNTVTAFIVPEKLGELAALAVVENIQEAQQPDVEGAGLQGAATAVAQDGTCAARVISEGDQQLNAAAARAAFDIDGSGITVGALSDSYDSAPNALTNALSDVASGELPGPGNPCGYVTPVKVVVEGSSTTGTDEGRAMLQIIHDLAPGANLTFATANGGMFAFADNIRKLKESGAQIIVDDVGYLQEPFYQDGPVSVAIDEVTSQGAMYVKAVGNSNAVDSAGNMIGSYEASYRPAPCPATIGADLYTDCQAFDAATNDTTMGLTLKAGGGFTLVLQWAQPWYGVETDLDIFVSDANGTVLARGTNTNTGKKGTQTPYETFKYANTTAASQQLFLVIARHSGPTVQALKYVMVRSVGITATEYNATNSNDTFGATVVGHATAAAALSVGAIPFTNKYSPEPFSSRGAATIYFSAVKSSVPGSLLATPDIRYKPDLLATDGVRTSFFGSTTNGVHRFYGTSAAAPHAAAVAALMHQLAGLNEMHLDYINGASMLKSSAFNLALTSEQGQAAGLIDALKATSMIAPVEVYQSTIYLPLVVK